MALSLLHLGCRLDDPGLNASREKKFIFSTKGRDLLCDPPQPLLNMYRFSFYKGQRTRLGRRLTTHLYLVPSLRTSGALPPLPLHVFWRVEG
jgi:hypothetical protein